ncbi:Rtc4p SCDLUD_003917 [Saccharomycodes ludwigii]|uniref:Rtc4p n=1 Tax=Saccharomycodes ludwigii TaxID=36035 RepID=UPI001E81ECFA|nr:hypothetical protein SCDLUD_003917 [Saccharomycodes ludwigii]KAH3899636.1 hypothetical protein SCDLUD_003917 [Saccharomycodes ludwigii]
MCSDPKTSNTTRRRAFIYNVSKKTGDNKLGLVDKDKNKNHDNNVTQYNSTQPLKKKRRSSFSTALNSPLIRNLEDKQKKRKTDAFDDFNQDTFKTDTLSAAFENDDDKSSENGIITDESDIDEELEKALSSSPGRELKKIDYIELRKMKAEKLKDAALLGRLEDKKKESVQINKVAEKMLEKSHQKFQDIGKVLDEINDETLKFERKLKLRHRYMQLYPHLPPVLNNDELESSVREFLPLCLDILKGKRTSIYYGNAKMLCESSTKAMLNVEELRQVLYDTPEKFQAGFYGLKRQTRVADLILTKYKGEIERAYKNPIVKWWGVDDFSKYVLSPEILAHCCKNQMNLETIDDAWDIMEKTTEFGSIVADTDPLDKWEIDFEREKLEKLGLGVKYGSEYYKRTNK